MNIWAPKQTKSTILYLDVANLVLELLQLLLKGGVLLGHLLVLLLPLVTLVLEGLHLSLEVSGLDVGLSEPKKLCSQYMMVI